MPWVRIDEDFPDHRKLAELGDYAPLCGWLFLCGLAYCNRQLTDGRIPWGHIERLTSFARISIETGRAGPATIGDDVRVPALAAKLIDVGLWEDHETHIQVHHYLEYQPSRAEVDADREQKREAGRAGGLARAKHRAKHSAKRLAKQPASESLSTPLAGRQAECLADTQAESKPDPDPDPSTDQIPKGSVPHAPPVPRERARAPERVTEVSLLPKNTRWAGRPAVPDFVHAELLQRLAPGETEADLLAFYARTAATWADRPIGDDNPRFWRARFTEWKGSTTPGTGGRNAMTDGSMDALRRFAERRTPK